MQSTDMARIVVLGAGFAGLWAAIGAARKREEIGAAGRDIEIRVIDRNPYHNIRVRNYEADLSEVALPLPQLLDPIGVSHRDRRGRSHRSGTARDFAGHGRRRRDAGL
ncbi:NADH dehydrogenase FAD-containing subunit [Bradyrhizobium sp. GM5.1]